MAAQAPPGEEQNIQLPHKLNIEHVYRAAGAVPVRINAFEMDMRQAPDKVYQYELRFQGEFPKRSKKGKEPQLELRDLARGPRNDESKETRREMHWSLFQMLLGQQQQFFGDNKREYSYDCALLLFSMRKLNLKNGERREFVVELGNRETLSDRSRAYLRNCERVKGSLVATEEVDVRNARVTEPGGDRSLCQFLELLSSQRLHERNEHFMFGNRMYGKNSVIQLQGDPRICKEGMQKNVRFVGDNPQHSKAIIQLDAKKSAFFAGEDLLEFIGRFLNCQPHTIEQTVARDYNRINKQIKGLVVQTVHLPENQVTFATQGLTNKPAHEITFQINGNEVNLVEYFQQKHNRRLNYPRLPCAIQRRGTLGDSFYPIEVLVIVEGQRVPLEKQTPKLTEQMIRQCQVLPMDLPRGIETQRDAGMIQNANPFFRAHNIRVDTEMVKAEAQLMFPPALVHNPPNTRIEPDQRGAMDWKLSGRGAPPQLKYIQSCEFPRVWAVVIVQNAVRREECQRFCADLLRLAQNRGVQMQPPPRVDNFEETDLEYVREKFHFYSQHRCQFVLFFAPGKQQAHPGDVHHVFKLAEQNHGVLTQHVSPQIMQKGISDRGAMMVLDNIMLKMNLKMGGANYDIAAAQAFKQANRIQHDILGDQWLGAKRMFFGMELSHAPPQSLFERKTGKTPANPTIVGMAYTLTKQMLKLNGTYWMQQPRMTTVQHTQPLETAVKAALLRYHDQSGEFPEHVFLYRAGASEGEYKKVAFYEGGAFERTFDELMKEGKMRKKPALTVIVCQRNSNYRIIPKDIRQGRAPEQNCQPGTVLDKAVMHSSLTEFLLVGHRTIQGTAQPVRCTVVYDSAQPRVPLAELEQISYALCYQHGICTSPTSIPGVLYSAQDLAKRGRNNWRTHTDDSANAQLFDLPPQDQPEDVRAQAQAQLDEQRDQYFTTMTDELRPGIPTKFWA